MDSVTFEIIHLNDESCIVAARNERTGQMYFGVDVAADHPTPGISQSPPPACAAPEPTSR